MKHFLTYARWQAAFILALGIAMCIPLTVQAQENTLSDVNVSSAVTTALINDQGVAGADLDVLTQEGIVTLAGSVTNLLAKNRAIALAKTVKGVRGVIDRIKITPIEKTDKEIQTDVVNALLWDPATEAYDISTTVNDGIVTLTGQVESWQERDLAQRIVKGISGVNQVNNRIEVEYAIERMDNEMEEDIVSALSWSRYVDNSLIVVDVNNDKVTLTGTVGSLAEKDEAIRLSYVLGVESVDASGLEVESWAREERFRKDKYTDREDNEINEAVTDALFYDPRVRSFNVDVSSNNGNVTLQGTVSNLKAKRSAAQTARNIIGVWRVKNQIKVKPETPTDATIKQRIKGALRANPYTESYEIGIAVKNGKVTLAGTVDTYFEKARADDIAARIYGVLGVRNLLQVDDKYNILVNNPFVDTEWFVYDYPWYVYPAYHPVTIDAEIRQDIESELFWSPFVDADQVNVKVDNAVATLTGEVDTWAEYWAAQENAFEGGAVLVNNDLFVGYGPDYLF